MCSSFPPHVAHLFDLDDVDDDVLGEIELLKHEAKIETTDMIRTKVSVNVAKASYLYSKSTLHFLYA